MTIKFLADYGPYKIGNTVTLTSAEESSLVNQKVATTDLTGGIPYTAATQSILSAAIRQVLSIFQNANPLITGLAGVGNGKIYDENGNEIVISGGGSRFVNTIGTYRPFGCGGQVVEGQAPTNSISRIPSKAAFSRVRLIIMRRDLVPLTTVKALVAATDDITSTAIANAYHPRVGGVSRNVMSVQNSMAEGWKTVTFGGSATYDNGLYGGTGQEGAYDPSGSYTSCPDVLVSDWIRVRSLSPANALLIRLSLNGGVIEGSGISSQPQASGLYSVNTGGDATVLTNIPGAVPSGTGQFPYIAVEFDHEVPVRNFATVGDSVTEGYQWNHNAINAVSSATKPCYSINLGASSHRWEEFTAIALAYMKKTKNITDVVLPTFSVNDSSEVLDSNFTRFGEDVQIARVQAFIDLCNKAGIQVWLWTNYAGFISSSSGSNDFRTVNINNWARRICAQGKAKLVDIEAGWDRSLYLSGDNTHPNAAGIAYMQGVFTAALQAGGI